MLKGSVVALVTPFKHNEIDYSSLDNLLDFHLQNNTDGILLCGTTGESPALAGDEKEQLVRYVSKKIDNRIPLMLGTGTNNFHHTLSATLRAQEWGVDYALVITPYYNKPTQRGLQKYFEKIAEKTEIPLVIYNVPGRTGVNIEADTVIDLAERFPNIIGIKEASGNLVQITKIIKETAKNFSVMSGEDGLNLPILSCGANGAISVTANILPAEVHEMIILFESGKYNQALDLHQKLFEINNALFWETNPIPVKAALAQMGLIENEIRLPLITLSEKYKSKLNDVLKKYDLIK